MTGWQGGNPPRERLRTPTVLADLWGRRVGNDLSPNDATAVVLTPAVAAAVNAAKAKEPLPYLLICGFIANAASFVLPISNPANLVIYGNHMPPLLQWLPAYLLPSAMSIVATYLVLRWTQRGALHQILPRTCRFRPFREEENGRPWNRVDGGGAPVCVRPRPPARPAYRCRRERHRSGRANRQPRGSVEHREGYFLECAATRRRAFRVGRGAR